MGFSQLLARWNTMSGADRSTLALLLLGTVVALLVSIGAVIWARLEAKKDRRSRRHFKTEPTGDKE